MRKTLALVVCVVAFAATVTAQKTQGPYTTSDRLQWAAPANVGTILEAMALEPRLYVNGGSYLVVPGQACAGAPIVCVATLNAAAVQLLNRVGRHAIRLSLAHPDGGEGEQSLPFTVRSAPGAPTGFGVIPPAQP